MKTHFTPHQRIIAPTHTKHVKSVDNSSNTADASPFSVVITAEKGIISVKAINCDSVRTCNGVPVHPGNIYFSKSYLSGIIKNHFVCADNRLLKINFKNQKDVDVQAQIASIVQDHASEIVEMGLSRTSNDHSGNRIFAEGGRGRSQIDNFNGQVRNFQRTVSIVGDQDLTRAQRVEEKTQNWNASVAEKPRGSIKDRSRVSDRHAFADRHSALFLAQQELTNTDPTASRRQAAKWGNLNRSKKDLLARLNELSNTRRSDLRLFPVDQLRFRHDWIPHEAVKRDPRRRSGKRTTGRGTVTMKHNGKQGRDDTKSHNVILAKSKFHTQLRREDRAAVNAGLRDILESENPISETSTTFETFIAMYLGRYHILSEEMMEHRTLIDALMRDMKSRYPRTPNAYVSPEITAREFEAFIEKNPDPTISHILAKAIQNIYSQKPTSMIHSIQGLIDAGADIKQLDTIVSVFSKPRYSKQFDACYGYLINTLHFDLDKKLIVSLAEVLHVKSSMHSDKYDILFDKGLNTLLALPYDKDRFTRFFDFMKNVDPDNLYIFDDDKRNNLIANLNDIFSTNIVMERHNIPREVIYDAYEWNKIVANFMDRFFNAVIEAHEQDPIVYRTSKDVKTGLKIPLALAVDYVQPAKPFKATIASTFFTSPALRDPLEIPTAKITITDSNQSDTPQISL